MSSPQTTPQDTAAAVSSYMAAVINGYGKANAAGWQLDDAHHTLPRLSFRGGTLLGVYQVPDGEGGWRKVWH